MRLLAAPALAVLLLGGCSRHHRPDEITTPATTLTAPPTSAPPSAPATTPTTSSATTDPAAPAFTVSTTSTTSPATSSAADPSVPTGDPEQVGRRFLRASLDGDAVLLGKLSHPSYRIAAQTLWISDTGPTGQAILATKVLELAAGHARVAVFVDAGDAVLAALPYTVELTQDPATGTWLVIDAGLTQP
jgi:outer membrane murein-binding lipoprotein Lpp